MAANRLAAIIEQEDVLSLEVDIISQITERFSALRDAEKKVAKLIMDDIQSAANASITELAENAQVSEATITRLSLIHI